jgi:hypothetical protein
MSLGEHDETTPCMMTALHPYKGALVKEHQYTFVSMNGRACTAVEDMRETSGSLS